MAAEFTDFEPWMTRWRLEPDGEPFASPFGSRFLPVVWRREAAMLKVAVHPEERRGGAVMAWYRGGGAARVFAHDDVAVVLERLEGPRSLEAMARGGEDEAACRILCEMVGKLQAPREPPLPDVLVPIDRWFRALWPTAERLGGVYDRAAGLARELLAEPEPAVVLHGDLHHSNVLDGGAGGWRAIDPKGVLGHRGFDYANQLCNPDAQVAIANLEARLAITAEVSGLPRERLLAWLVAYLGLSAAWTLSIDGDPWQALAIAEAARRQR